jgi:hypothetical protein
LEKVSELSREEIPTDKRGLIARMFGLNEGDLAKALRVFIEVCGGRYPSRLEAKTTIKEASALGERLNAIPKAERENKAQDIFFASAYHEKLAREKKDVKYYGDKVTLEENDKVLIRWKLSDNEYRVIFGDLSAANLTDGKLAELERQLAQ